MSTITYGTYKNGQIVLDIPRLSIEESEEKQTKKGNNLLDVGEGLAISIIGLAELQFGAYYSNA
jgi:hypothetical protein